MKGFSIIVALDNENGIGKGNSLAWGLPEDVKYFKEVTSKTKDSNKQNAVIMGRKTWESIPEKYRPLPGRKNFILSSKYAINGEKIDEQTMGFGDFCECFRYILKQKDIEETFVIGGAQIYNHAITLSRFQKAYITRVYDKFHCDVFFDGLPKDFKLIGRSQTHKHGDIEFEMSVYKRRFSLIRFIKRLFHK